MYSLYWDGELALEDKTLLEIQEYLLEYRRDCDADNRDFGEGIMSDERWNDYVQDQFRVYLEVDILGVYYNDNE